MTARRWIGPYLCYNSAYGGESLRANASTGLANVQRALQLCATSSQPIEATLTVYDAQSETLYRATRGKGPRTDDGMAQRGSLGAPNPLVASAEAAFGPGLPHRFAEGASGDLWETQWKIDLDTPGFAETWERMAQWVVAHGDADPIRWSFGDTSGYPTDPQVELNLHYAPIWKFPDQDAPMPGQPIHEYGTNRLLVFLRRNSSVILDIWVPLSQVDPTFATWEMAFCDALGIQLAPARWRLGSYSSGPGGPSIKHDQGRYRRLDWTADGKAAGPPAGPWDTAIEGILAPKVTLDERIRLKEELETHPRGPVVFGLVTRMAALKGAPLERGESALTMLAAEPEGRHVLAPAFQWLFQYPPPSKQMRAIAYSLRAVAGDDWYLELAYEQLETKKIPPVIVDLFAEMTAPAYAYDRAPGEDPLARPRFLAALLRKLRTAKPSPRRGEFTYRLGACDDGSAWATWMLEAATPMPTFESRTESWSWYTLRQWAGARKVVDPRAAPYMAMLPPLDELIGNRDQPQPFDLVLTDEQRAELDAIEHTWL